MVFVMVFELVASLILYFISKSLKAENLHKISKILLHQGFLTFVIFNVFNISFSLGTQLQFLEP